GVEDWDFWIGCGEKGYVGRRIPEVLFFYRAKAGSMIHTLQPHLKAMFARIVLNHPAIYGAAAVQQAEKVMAAAQLPPPKPSSQGVEWLPENPSPAAALLQRAQQAFAARDYAGALTHLRQACEMSLT